MSEQPAASRGPGNSLEPAAHAEEVREAGEEGGERGRGEQRAERGDNDESGAGGGRLRNGAGGRDGALRREEALKG